MQSNLYTLQLNSSLCVVAEILDVLQQVLSDLDSKINEISFLQADNYGKFCICVDEMMPDVSKTDIIVM